MQAFRVRLKRVINKPAACASSSVKSARYVTPGLNHKIAEIGCVSCYLLWASDMAANYQVILVKNASRNGDFPTMLAADEAIFKMLVHSCSTVLYLTIQGNRSN